MKWKDITEGMEVALKTTRYLMEKVPVCVKAVVISGEPWTSIDDQSQNPKAFTDPADEVFRSDPYDRKRGYFFPMRLARTPLHRRPIKFVAIARPGTDFVLNSELEARYLKPHEVEQRPAIVNPSALLCSWAEYQKKYGEIESQQRREEALRAQQHDALFKRIDSVNDRFKKLLPEDTPHMTVRDGRITLEAAEKLLAKFDALREALGVSDGLNLLGPGNEGMEPDGPVIDTEAEDV